jgi:FKBP-type peptidyl-prolyl cis-trans isomerase
VAKPHQRALALGLAVLFLATSVATGLAVLWQIHSDNQTSKTAQTAVQAQEQQSQEGKLQGTKLADFTPVDKVDALQVTDIKVGDGEEVKPGATVTAHYTGALAKDGTIFQSSKDMGQPVEFSLSGVIPGWTEGVPGMKVGGTRRLLIPAAKAYGDQSPSEDIPANADLVFDIELTAVKNP